MWPEALETGGSPLVSRAPDYEQSMLRLFGIPESEIAETLRVAGTRSMGLRLEITTCLRRGEVEVVVRHEPADQAAWTALAELIADRHARHPVLAPTAPPSTTRSQRCWMATRSPWRSPAPPA